MNLLRWCFAGLTVSFLFVSALHAAPLRFEDSYQQFQGEPVSLNALIGRKPVYLKLWASWCLDCRKQMPELQAAYDKYHKQVAIYAVNLNINENEKALQTIKDKYHLTVPIVLDNNGSIAGNFHFSGTPFHVLINRHGEVVYSGYKADTGLFDKLEQLARATSLKRTTEGLATEENHVVKPTLPHGFAVRYFSASWCGWYFGEVDPAMAHNCSRGDRLASDLYSHSRTTSADVNWTAYVTSFWTAPADIDDYRQKQKIPYAIEYDEDNRQARNFQVNQYPTLILYRDGKELQRITRFDDPQKLLQGIEKQMRLE